MTAVEAPSTRRREIFLLILAGTFLALNALSLALLTGEVTALALVIAWGAAAGMGYRQLNRLLPHHDPFVYPLAMLLSGWGVLLIQRLAPNFAWRQVLWLYIGVAVMLAISALPTNLRWLRRYRYTWLFGGLSLLLITILLGVNPSGYGPRLWLGAAGIYFQPSELLKVVLVIFAASYLADHRDALRRGGEGNHRRRLMTLLVALGPLVLMWGLCMVVVIWQQDLGTATLFFIIFLAMLYIASGRAIYLLAGLILLLAAAAAAYHLFDVVQLRVDIWLNPWPAEARDRAFQIVQSLLAFSSGGILGQGIGQGSPTYIPVVHSDFVFAAIGEEWGLIGALAVLTCLATLAMRGFHVAVRWSEMHFRLLLAAGLSVLLGTQSILITGGVLKVIPLTGVTLPFVSYGGSSLLINFAVIGLFLLLSAPPPSPEKTPS